MKKASLALAVSVGLCSPAIWATTQIDVLGLYTPDTAKGFKQEHVASNAAQRERSEQSPERQWSGHQC